MKVVLSVYDAYTYMVICHKNNEVRFDEAQQKAIFDRLRPCCTSVRHPPTRADIKALQHFSPTFRAELEVPVDGSEEKPGDAQDVEQTLIKAAGFLSKGGTTAKTTHVVYFPQDFFTAYVLQRNLTRLVLKAVWLPA